MYINTIEVNAITTGKEPRKYSILIPRQKLVLEAAFANNYFLNKTTLMHLTQQTGLCKGKILRWFKHRRSCIRRASEKGTISVRECILNYLSVATFVYIRIH